MKAGFRILPHTSEMVLEVGAPDWPSFYRAAAEGLLAVYGLRPGKSGIRKLRRSIQGESPEDTLVAWLAELIFLVGTKRMAPQKIEIPQAGPLALEAVVHAGPARELPLEREVKAATYHGLKVAAGRAGLKARLILDV
jgi:SHS2 domain-containing protein